MAHYRIQNWLSLLTFGFLDLGRESRIDEREQQRIRHRLAMICHVEEVIAFIARGDLGVPASLPCSWLLSPKPLGMRV